MPRKQQIDLGSILENGIKTIAKEVKRLSNLQLLESDDAALLIDYVKTISALHKDTLKADKDVTLDLSKLTPDELDAVIARNQDDPDE